MDNNLKYYVYIHANPSGDVFYVGKGSGRRAYSFRDRSWVWREAFERHDGILIRILKRFSNEVDAFAEEQKLISQYISEGAALVNQTEGGAGPYGYKQHPCTRALKSARAAGYKHKLITCPHCGFTGGATATRRWHFDNCEGLRPTFKARVTVAGTRVYLGKHHTMEEAKAAEATYLEILANEGVAKDGATVTVSDGSVWTVL